MSQERAPAVTTLRWSVQSGSAPEGARRRAASALGRGRGARDQGRPRMTVSQQVQVQVTVPADTAGGMRMMVDTASGPMEAVVPDGLQAGDSFAVSVPAVIVDSKRGLARVAPVPARAASAGDVDGVESSHVPEAVRNRRWAPIHHSHAALYSRSLSSVQTSATAAAGCHTLRSTDGCLFGANYLFACSDDCIWSPLLCAFGVPIPCSICFCASERRDNYWVTRGSMGKMTGMLSVVDAEKGTLASYGVHGCAAVLNAYPDCYCEKL